MISKNNVIKQHKNEIFLRIFYTNQTIFMTFMGSNIPKSHIIGNYVPSSVLSLVCMAALDGILLHMI